MVVIVPARDEARTIGACLRSIDRAAHGWGGPVVVVVGADRCDDDTAAVARATPVSHLEVTVLETDLGRVGRVRRSLTEHGLTGAGRRPARPRLDLERTWLASTDGDGTVAPDWIQRQVDHADRGAHLVLGVVDLADDAPAGVTRPFADAYRAGPSAPHPHVHGANLGIRASTYTGLGGWDRRVVVGEDHDLAAAAAAAGVAVVADHRLVVTTSARTQGRVRGGFADVLAGLAEPTDVSGPRRPGRRRSASPRTPAARP